MTLNLEHGAEVHGKQNGNNDILVMTSLFVRFGRFRSCRGKCRGLASVENNIKEEIMTIKEELEALKVRINILIGECKDYAGLKTLLEKAVACNDENEYSKIINLLKFLVWQAECPIKNTKDFSQNLNAIIQGLEPPTNGKRRSRGRGTTNGI